MRPKVHQGSSASACGRLARLGGMTAISLADVLGVTRRPEVFQLLLRKLLNICLNFLKYLHLLLSLSETAK
jgi:hypothetical protein